MPLSNPGNFGGQTLRRLRERRKLTQDELGLDGVIAQANYSKIERGLSMPSRGKLVAILDALQPTFKERQEILSLFGYISSQPLPTCEELETACQVSRPLLDEIPAPAYIVDILTRLVAWNHYCAMLIGGDQGILEQLEGEPLIRAQIESRIRLKGVMEGVEEQLLDDALTIRERLAPYEDEEWCAEFIQELCSIPDFAYAWEKAQTLPPLESAPIEFAARLINPVTFHLVDGNTILAFYSNPETYRDDSRFEVVGLLPADSFTMRQLERWRSES